MKLDEYRQAVGIAGISLGVDRDTVESELERDQRHGISTVEWARTQGYSPFTVARHMFEGF